MSDKVKIPDLTFLFLVRLDTIERLENLLAVTKFISSNFITQIIVLECAAYKNSFLEKLLEKKIKYNFQEDSDPILYRTKLLNQMIYNVKTPFVSIWDTDVLAASNQIIKSIEILRKGEASFVYPYEKHFLDTSAILRKMYLNENNFEILEQSRNKMKELYLPLPLGGAFLADLKKYIDSGMENENFYGWGLEDGERYYRWQALGYTIKRVPGPLFHLSHPRGYNSLFHDNDQQILKRKEVLRIKRKV